LYVIVQCDQQAELGVVNTFLKERSESDGIDMGINASAVFHLNGDAPGTHGDYEIHFWLRSSCREVGDVKIRYRSQEIP
jgi:hypothetical protein